jgi:hypothetical protein
MTDAEEHKPLLDDRQAERFARQIILPEVGARGQARLCSSRVAIVGTGPGADAARAYLEAAGVAVPTAPYVGRVDGLVITDVLRARERGALPPCAAESPVSWYSLAGTTLHAGTTTASLARTVCTNAPSSSEGRAASLALHRLGGCDAAAAMLAALLGWSPSGESHSVEL